jgi:hypothetical protein
MRSKLHFDKGNMKIFRFEKNSTARLETIQRGEIYISCPENFNALEDCRIQKIFSPNFDWQFHEQLLKCIEILYPKTSHNYFPLQGAEYKHQQFTQHWIPAKSMRE